MTVSRVMNNDPKVGKKTREKISAIAKEMNYKPNIAARHLASSKSYMIGIVCEFANASYVNKFLVGALKKCKSTGYHIVIDETSIEKSKVVAVIKDLVDISRVDGLILLPPISDIPEVISLLCASNTPFVRIAPDHNLGASPYICMDDYQAAYDATETLIKSGHKRIAHILGSNQQGVSKLRYKGYLDALHAHQLSMPIEYSAQGDFSYKSGLSAAKKLLELPEPPDAIFAANDEMAAAVVSVAHMKHIAIGQQLSIMGFDDTELSTTVWPSISTVCQPLEEMAKLAVELLTTPYITKKSTSGPAPNHKLGLKKDTMSNDEGLRYVLDYKIINRESSKPPK